MNINKEHQLIRIQLLANANFGSASGAVTLDRPTQLDAYYEMPFIPNSSLRGVMRAVCQYHQDPHSNEAFGISDTDNEGKWISNMPGKLVIGNGDLLTFPVLSETGERCWVFPVQNIYKFLALEALVSAPVKLEKLARLIYAGVNENRHNVLGIPAIPLFNIPFTIQQVSLSKLGDELKTVVKSLSNWCGNWIPGDEPLLIVAHQTARYLWNLSSEVRDTTALNKKKNAQSQSLRRIETIPEGSLFLSLVTYHGAQPINFTDDPIQVGSKEGTGLGFCRLTTVEGTTIKPLPSPVAASPAGEMPTNAEIMMEIYKAVNQLANSPETNDAIKKKTRAAIGDFGWRMQAEGTEAAIAFALARAKPHSAKHMVEIKAYRWLLQNLLELNENLDPPEGGKWFKKDFSEAEKMAIRQRWLWLRKYAEIQLKAEHQERILS